MVTFQIQHHSSTMRFYIEQVDGTLVLLSIDGEPYSEAWDADKVQDIVYELVDIIQPADHGGAPQFIATFTHTANAEDMLIQLEPLGE